MAAKMAIAAAVLGLSAAGAARAACEVDADCKGGRICVANRCVAAEASVRPAPAPQQSDALESSFYLAGGSASLSPASGPGLSSGSHAEIGVEFAGELSPPFGIGGGLHVQYTNFDQGIDSPNISDVNVKVFLGPRLKVGPARFTVGPAGIFTIFAAEKKLFDGSYSATHFGVGLYARGEVLLFRHVGLFGILGIDGSVYDAGGGSTSQVDFGGGLIIAF